ncbi:hypothetical protein [Streptomyces sp. cg36]|uniref:hypothetical protein n=1 Tax=Streptomyces sp. cg36 TaxID=3238798 RepID=UPI0034E253B8
MRVRGKYEYVDAIQWLGDANYSDVCAFIGIPPQAAAEPARDGARRIYLPGEYEFEAVPGDWILRDDMVGRCLSASSGEFARTHDQQGVGEAGLVDFPFLRRGVARYRRKPRHIEALQWLGDTNFAEVCRFVGVPEDEGADRGWLSLPAPSYAEEPRTAVPGQWILRWPNHTFLSVSPMFMLENYDPVDPGEHLLKGVAPYQEREDATYVEALYWNGADNYREVCAFSGAKPQDESGDRGVLHLSEHETAVFPGSWIIRQVERGRVDVTAEDYSGHMEHWYALVVPPDSGPLGHPAQWKRPQRFCRLPWPALAIQWRGEANLAEVCAFLGRPLPGPGDDRTVIHLPERDEQAVTPGMWIVFSVLRYRGLTAERFHEVYEPCDPPSDPRLVRTADRP